MALLEFTPKASSRHSFDVYFFGDKIGDIINESSQCYTIYIFGLMVDIQRSKKEAFNRVRFIELAELSSYKMKADLKREGVKVA